MRGWWRVGISGLMLLMTPAAVAAQGVRMELTVEAAPALDALADRVRRIDRESLATRLAEAGLNMPPAVMVELITDDDPRARAMPTWIVGVAFGQRNVVIFPARVGPYPYESLESVVSHEVVHLALTAQADGPLPRWFHEGVATSVEQGWGLSGQARLVFATVANPILADLGRLFQSNSEQENVNAYLLAAALVADIRERHGANAPGRIVDQVAQGTPFPRAFLLQTGETPEQAATRAWERYRRWTNWIPVLASGSALWIGILTLSCVAFLATLRRRARLRRHWDSLEDDWDAEP
ncbi:MAG: hypothetical protein O2930_07495 [Acidobacteria bacterium]|nr:hypothetical protein [Acidobacteriota bacterium]